MGTSRSSLIPDIGRHLHCRADVLRLFSYPGYVIRAPGQGRDLMKNDNASTVSCARKDVMMTEIYASKKQKCTPYPGLRLGQNWNFQVTKEPGRTTLLHMSVRCRTAVEARPRLDNQLDQY
eukprot:g69056.t1